MQGGPVSGLAELSKEQDSEASGLDVGLDGNIGESGINEDICRPPVREHTPSHTLPNAKRLRQTVRETVDEEAQVFQVASTPSRRSRRACKRPGMLLLMPAPKVQKMQQGSARQGTLKAWLRPPAKGPGEGQPPGSEPHQQAPPPFVPDTGSLVPAPRDSSPSSASRDASASRALLSPLLDSTLRTPRRMGTSGQTPRPACRRASFCPISTEESACVTDAR